ncbi:MAG: putative dsRNA-binding protein [Candidatus Treponema excrementipullorum]|nr:putative dsRNA-binding protein [Candidatus Treponema excrementipullorum]
MALTNTYDYLRCNINTIEETIGYRFHDRNLLIQAFTSKSFGAENPSFEDNDVLEFYGDAELYKFLSDCLFDSFTVYPDGTHSNQLTSKKSVGELSEIRKNYINKKTLAWCLRLKHLDQFVLLGKSDLNNNAAGSDSILEDVFEALVGAVKVDSTRNNPYSLVYINTKDAVKTVCHNLYEMYEFESDWYQEVLDFCNYYEVKLDEYKSGYSNNYIYYLEIPALQFSSQGEGRSPEVARLKAAEALMHDCEIYDMKQEVGEADFDTSVSQLNELFQKEYITQPEYSFKNTTDSDGHQIWRCECFISSYEDKEGYMQRGIGEENSKAEAKKAAAFDMLQFIYDER